MADKKTFFRQEDMKNMFLDKESTYKKCLREE